MNSEQGGIPKEEMTQAIKGVPDCDVEMDPDGNDEYFEDLLTAPIPGRATELISNGRIEEALSAIKEEGFSIVHAHIMLMRSNVEPSSIKMLVHNSMAYGNGKVDRERLWAELEESLDDEL